MLSHLQPNRKILKTLINWISFNIMFSFFFQFKELSEIEDEVKTADSCEDIVTLVHACSNAEKYSNVSWRHNFTHFQTTVPSLDDVVAVVNLLDQMIALLQMELATEAEDVLNSLEDEGDSNPDDPLSLSDSNSPCLDILLSENIPAHILAASRMPVSDCSLMTSRFCVWRHQRINYCISIQYSRIK